MSLNGNESVKHFLMYRYRSPLNRLPNQLNLPVLEDEKLAGICAAIAEEIAE